MANIKAAKQFVQQWQGKGDEKQETQAFWIQLLDQVFEDHQYNKDILFEQTADKIESGKYFKDVVIFRNTDHAVLVEQKGSKYGLDAKEPRHGLMLTPFEQAKEYDDKSGYNDKARWIITCNFREFWIYDMTKTGKELYSPVAKLKLEDLPKHLDWLAMLEPSKQTLPNFSDEVAVSYRAGELVGILYDDLHKNYKNPDDPENLRQLNILCVRIVFCLYAEDAGLFDRNNLKMFHDYLAQFDAQHMRKALAALFKVLDQKPEERDPYLADDDPMLAAFPYVNGGLFEGDVVIPPFTDETVDILLNKESLGFDWSKISPTIFGAVFESTLNRETRRSGGMHYTSVEIIHKVIDPLFLDDLRNELKEILELKTPNIRNKRLIAFQEKLGKIRCLDPACGSGNFLTESYLSLRRLENEALRVRFGKNISMGFEEAGVNPIQVSIQQFYGIEINDFAVSVAKTALWIAEAQMFEETQSILNSDKEFLPLQTFSNIHEGNALRMDWNDVIDCRTDHLFIMGNPPFVGQQHKSKSQSEDMSLVFGSGTPETKLDYVTAWYYKALKFMESSSAIHTAFVSTNSICQGESVPTFWKRMVENGAEIIFAHRSFKWTSESNNTAVVICIVVGFTNGNYHGNKILYEGGLRFKAAHINAYLMDAPDLWITSRKNIPPKGMPKMTKGSEPSDGGELFFTSAEKDELEHKYPYASDCIMPFVGGDEYLNNPQGKFSRYCIWLVGKDPSQYKNIHSFAERFKKIHDKRLASSADRIKKRAEFPYLFCQIRQPKDNYLLFPQHTSSTRQYIPIGFMKPEVIVGNACYIIPNASLFMFGVLTSNVHMAWTRVVCGRLGEGYRYSPAIYNNFPWPNPSESQRSLIEQAAQNILDIREQFSERPLSSLYDPSFMPPELRKAHNVNDIAVMKAYGFSKDMSESDIVAALMKMYQELIQKQSIS